MKPGYAFAIVTVVLACFGCQVGASGTQAADSNDAATSGSEVGPGSGTGSGYGTDSGSESSSDGSTGTGSGTDSGSKSASDSGTDAASIDCSGVDLQQGAMGALVSEFQQLLQKDGYYLNEPIDGDFGPVTAGAIESFQMAQGLPATGVIDSATCAALENPKAAPPSPKVVYAMYVNPGATPTYDLNGMKAAGVTDILFDVEAVILSDGDLTTLKSQCDQAGLRLSAWIFTDATTSYVSHLANDLGYNIHLDLESYSSMAAGVAYVQSIRAACPGKLFTLVTKSVWDDPAAYNIDLPDMAQYVDAIVPMLYTGDYGKTDSALTSAVQATEQQYPNKVWAALETYESDANPSPKPLSDLQAEVAASQPNCQGVALFRYGLLSGYPSVGQ